MSKPAHKPVEVVGELSDCSGKQAGLQQGDIILDFNGYPTQEITPDILAVEFRKPQLTLKVQRKGISEPLSYTLTAQ